MYNYGQKPAFTLKIEMNSRYIKLAKANDAIHRQFSDKSYDTVLFYQFVHESFRKFERKIWIPRVIKVVLSSPLLNNV